MLIVIFFCQVRKVERKETADICRGEQRAHQASSLNAAACTQMPGADVDATPSEGASSSCFSTPASMQSLCDIKHGSTNNPRVVQQHQRPRAKSPAVCSSCFTGKAHGIRLSTQESCALGLVVLLLCQSLKWKYGF